MWQLSPRENDIVDISLDFFEEENGAYDPTEGTKKRGLAVLIGLWAGIAVISVIAILIHVKRRR